MDDEKEVFSRDLREIYGGRPAYGYVIMIMITTLVLLYVIVLVVEFLFLFRTELYYSC
ncbi:MAG: hypothetical protein RXQ80_09270 [Sulfolobaceae archaeon]|jgi:hypothetical protein|uniref:hypothetical protein n=1 Tax=Stygiolobus sp. RP850M TaxID=3133137 RepID=UPI00307F3170